MTLFAIFFLFVGWTLNVVMKILVQYLNRVFFVSLKWLAESQHECRYKLPVILATGYVKFKRIVLVRELRPRFLSDILSGPCVEGGTNLVWKLAYQNIEIKRAWLVSHCRGAKNCFFIHILCYCPFVGVCGEFWLISKDITSNYMSYWYSCVILCYLIFCNIFNIHTSKTGENFCETNS